MAQPDPAAVVEQFIDAYNRGDNEAVKGVCHENIHVTHHNRDITVEGREAFGGLLETFAVPFPDKHFIDRRGLYVDGDTVIVEHTWTATAEADVPGWANAGEVARLDLCTRYTVRDGLIVEYHDYG